MASITTTSAVYATDAPVVLDLEGNPTCSSLVENSIFEERDTSVPDAGVEKILTFDNGQELTYTIGGIDDETITAWDLLAPGEDIQLVFPVNFVILKGAGNAGARVFHYGKKGVTADTDLVGPGTLKTVTFCYGLNEEPIGEPEPVPFCDAEGFTLDGLTIDCSELGERSLHSVRKGDKFVYAECTCNKTATECDKSLAPGLIGACVTECDPEAPDYIACLEGEQLREVPAVINFWNNGSGWCSSMLGSYGCRTW
jgi:hypothetical protein